MGSLAWAVLVALAANRPKECQLRILGLDPGLNHTGWGVIEEKDNHFCHIASGVLDVPAGELSVRLGTITRFVQGIIRTHMPQRVAVEKVFVNLNAQSTLRLSQARAASLIGADLEGLSVAEYTPSEIKQAVTGNGAADKLMIQKMVAMLLNTPEEALRADQADALACAICYANTHKMQAYEHQGGTQRAYATARHGRTGRASRQAWTQELLRKGK